MSMTRTYELDPTHIRIVELHLKERYKETCYMGFCTFRRTKMDSKKKKKRVTLLGSRENC
jgi:hypothetical protein